MKTPLLFCFLFFSCTIADVAPVDGLIFGKVAIGWGCGNSRLFKLTATKLYADTTNGYCKAYREGQTYFFSGYELPDSEFQKAKNLANGIPANDFSITEAKTFGCPGCADGGMIYFEQISGRTTKKIRVDDTVLYKDSGVDGSAIPAPWVTFARETAKAIDAIKVK